MIKGVTREMKVQVEGVRKTAAARTGIRNYFNFFLLVNVCYTLIEHLVV